MQRSPHEEVHRLFERLYDKLDAPKLDRDGIRELTDEISTLTMTQIVPEPEEPALNWMEYGLTPQESRVICFLLQRKNKPVRKTTIHSHCWNDPYPEIKIVDVMVAKMRPKLAVSPISIRTIWGAGYAAEDNPHFDIEKWKAQAKSHKTRFYHLQSRLSQYGRNAKKGEMWHGVALGPEAMKIANTLKGSIGEWFSMKKLRGGASHSTVYRLHRRMNGEKGRYRIEQAFGPSAPHSNRSGLQYRMIDTRPGT